MDQVFVVHGRDVALTESLFAFLRSIGLKPLEWPQALLLTQAPTPQKVLESALNSAKAVVVLLSGDDEARLQHHFLRDTDGADERELTPQARPNVLFEAGMAFARLAERVVFVEMSRVRPFSDLAGYLTVRLDNTPQKRKELAERLRTVGCSSVDLLGDSWLTEGDLVVSRPPMRAWVNPKPVALDDSFTLDSVYRMYGNYTSPIEIASSYTHSQLELPDDIQEVYSFLAGQAKVAASISGAPYFNGPNTRLLRFTDMTRQDSTTGREQNRIALEFGPVSWEQYTVLNTKLGHRLTSGQTIGERYAIAHVLAANDRDFRWCKLSNIIAVACMPLTSDGYGLVQKRNPKGVSTEGNCYTSGIAENIHRYLDEADPERPFGRLHEWVSPAELATSGDIDVNYRPAEGRTVSPYLTAVRGLCEEVSEDLTASVPNSAFKFLNLMYELKTFHPMLVGVVELGLPLKEVERYIRESPGKDHAEHLKIEAVPLDSRNTTTLAVIHKEWIAGSLGALIAAIHYWRGRNRSPAEVGR